jgi:polar amino acid transport system substrate-binding protein
MKKFVKTWVCLFLLFSKSHFLYGEENLKPEVKKIKVGFADAPPYANAKTKEGFEIDVMRETLKLMGYDIEIVIYSRERAAQVLKNKEVDAASVGNNIIQDGVDGFYAKRCIPYYDFAVTKKSKNLKISKWEDLKNKKILGFQSAKDITGPEYKKNAVDGNPNYMELPDQTSQPLMLFSDRIEVSFGDANIFNYLAETVKDKVDINQPLEYNDVSVNIKNYQFSRPVFFSEDMRNLFNEKLDDLKKSGKYKELFEKWKILKAPIDRQNQDGFPY